MAKFVAVGTYAGHQWPNRIMFSVKDSQGKLLEGSEIIDIIGGKFLEHIDRVIPIRTTDKIGKLKIEITIQN